MLRTFFTPPRWSLDLKTGTLCDHCHVDIRRTVFDDSTGLPKLSFSTHIGMLVQTAGVWGWVGIQRDPETGLPMKFSNDQLDQLTAAIARDVAHYATPPDSGGVIAAPPMWRVSDATGMLVPRARTVLHTYIDEDGVRRYPSSHDSYQVMKVDGTFTWEEPVLNKLTGEPLVPDVDHLGTKLDTDVVHYGAQTQILPPVLDDEGGVAVTVAHYVRDGKTYARRTVTVETAADKPVLDKLDMLQPGTRAALAAQIVNYAATLSPPESEVESE